LARKQRHDRQAPHRGGHLIRWHRSGHAYSAQSLVAAVSEELEQALWTAVRSLEEANLLLHHIAGHMRETGDAPGAEALEAEARQARHQSEAVRRVVMARATLSAAES
jgi:two-component system chemotaxis response regulator CheB